MLAFSKNSACLLASDILIKRANSSEEILRSYALDISNVKSLFLYLVETSM